MKFSLICLRRRKKTIDASRECYDLLLDVICILGDLEVTIEEVGEDSEGNRGDDEVL